MKQGKLDLEDKGRKAILYEMAKLLDRFADRKTINATEMNSYRVCAKLCRKEGRDPGSLEKWLAIEHPTTGIV